MTVLLNDPNCQPCAATPAAGLPVFIATDLIRVNLTANVPYVVTFVNIRNCTSATQWMRNYPDCRNSAGDMVFPTISAETGTGFTVTAPEDCLFQVTCSKMP